MSWLIVGLVLFIGCHLVPMVPALRGALVSTLGENPYKAAVSLFAFAGLGLIVYGYSKAGFVPVYTPPAWGRMAAPWLMLPVFPLLVAAYAPTNIKRFTRHPMLWATTLWAVAHLLANGDAASLALFGAFGVWALLDMASANARGAQLQTQHVPWTRDVIVIVIGLLVYLVVAWLHTRVLGVPSGVF